MWIKRLTREFCCLLFYLSRNDTNGNVYITIYCSVREYICICQNGIKRNTVISIIIILRWCLFHFNSHRLLRACYFTIFFKQHSIRILVKRKKSFHLNSILFVLVYGRRKGKKSFREVRNNFQSASAKLIQFSVLRYQNVLVQIERKISSTSRFLALERKIVRKRRQPQKFSHYKIYTCC